MERGSYHKIVPNLIKVFGEENIYFEFYENLFSENSIREIVNFLEIDYLPPDFQRRVNESPRELELTDVEIAEAINVFHPTYKFCRSYFQDRVPHSWLG